MASTLRKFIAVILIIWLPLFSGNALAVALQVMSGDEIIMHEAHEHCASSAQADQDQSADHQERCGTCHLVCCGYLAATAIEMLDAQPSAQLYTQVTTQFQSIISTPLDPPPLASV